MNGTFTMPTAVVLTLNGTISVAGLTSLTDGTINGKIDTLDTVTFRG